jgi:hypothetical protein
MYDFHQVGITPAGKKGTKVRRLVLPCLCLVLSHRVVSCFVLSYLALPCLVLFFVLSHRVVSCLVLPCLVLSREEIHLPQDDQYLFFIVKNFGGEINQRIKFFANLFIFPPIGIIRYWDYLSVIRAPQENHGICLSALPCLALFCLFYFELPCLVLSCLL